MLPILRQPIRTNDMGIMEEKHVFVSHFGYSIQLVKDHVPSFEYAIMGHHGGEIE